MILIGCFGLLAFDAWIIKVKVRKYGQELLNRGLVGVLTGSSMGYDPNDTLPSV